MLRRLLIAGSGGSFTPPIEVDDMRGTSVKRTTNLSTPFDYYDSGETGFANNGVVEFHSAEFDDDVIWDIGDPTKLGPVPSAYNGKRAIFHGEAIWNATAVGYREIKIFRNSNLQEPIAVNQVAQATGNVGVQCDSRPIVLATGDYFELCLRSENSSTALAAEDYSITFSIAVFM